MTNQCESFSAGLKILVVEDESIIAWDVEQMLLDHGAAEVLVAASIRQARAFLQAHSDIRLVLVDLKLEDGNGAELIADTAGKGIPTIITTGYGGYSGGSIPVITKPYCAGDLIGAALNALKT